MTPCFCQEMSETTVFFFCDMPKATGVVEKPIRRGKEGCDRDFSPRILPTKGSTFVTRYVVRAVGLQN